MPGRYEYVVGPAVRQLKIQAWGAGGGSGLLKGQIAGSGGGGALVEALVAVTPGEKLEVTVGSGGVGGRMASGTRQVDPDDPSKLTDPEETPAMAEVGW